MDLDEPEPRQLAFRLIAAWRAGPDFYRAEGEKLELTIADAGALIGTLVQIAGISIEAAAEKFGAASVEDFMLAAERGLDEMERHFNERQGDL